MPTKQIRIAAPDDDEQQVIDLLTSEEKLSALVYAGIVKAERISRQREPKQNLNTEASHE